MGFVDPVLVCHECLPKCRSEDAFYKSHLKALTSGACSQVYLQLRASVTCLSVCLYFTGANFTVAEDETVYMCRLSENH